MSHLPPPMGTREAWARFILHFGAWLGLFSVALYLLYKRGATLSRRWTVPAVAAFIFAVLLRELDSTRRGVQTKGKMWIDLAAKSAGALVAVATAKWWWHSSRAQSRD